jgi:DNA-binding MarR family transcriptional regulator
VTADTDLVQTAQELRTVLGRLIRRLRVEDTLPLRYMTVLGRLEREGPLTTSDLAQRERMRPQSMAETIKELEQDGLLTRAPDPEDGRRMLLTLTGAGTRTVREHRERRQEWLAEAIVQELNTGEQRVLARAIRLLQRIADS